MPTQLTNVLTIDEKSSIALMALKGILDLIETIEINLSNNAFELGAQNLEALGDNARLLSKLLSANELGVWIQDFETKESE